MDTPYIIVFKENDVITSQMSYNFDELGQDLTVLNNTKGINGVSYYKHSFYKQLYKAVKEHIQLSEKQLKEKVLNILFYI